MIKIDLSYHLVHQWSSYKNVSILGNIIYENQFLKPADAFPVFNQIETEESFVLQLQKTEGQFSLLAESEFFIFIAVDNIRTFPLFIQQKHDDLRITDHIDAKDEHWNESAMKDFIKVYCTLENTTLLKNYIQLQAGEYAVIDKRHETLSIKSYLKHSGNNSTLTIQEAENHMITGAINYADNRTILIPLSGGYDSRYLLALLLEKGYTAIECFTYGKKDSYEVLIAKNVCEKLKVKWHYIEYTDELLQTFFTEKWKLYSDLNHQFSSLPHEQDFFALHALKESHRLPKNAVIINGFCQDILAGSFIEPVPDFNLKKFIEYKYNLRPELHHYENSWNGYQEWLIKNRLSKFIVNSVRVYAYFGLDFYLPFWNSGWCQFWYSLPMEERKNQTFYKKHLFNGIFKNHAIDFKKPDASHTDSLHKIKRIGKSILPKSISHWWKTQQAKNSAKDYNNTLYLYEEIYQKLAEKPAEKDFRINNIHALYLLQNLKEQNHL